MRRGLGMAGDLVSFLITWVVASKSDKHGNDTSYTVNSD